MHFDDVAAEIKANEKERSILTERRTREIRLALQKKRKEEELMRERGDFSKGVKPKKAALPKQPI